ncbi:MAG: S8 family serine peptidase [Gallionellaceae bacterium]|nr:S8 family serine peptidase [Gallionellaceae bacterium]
MRTKNWISQHLTAGIGLYIFALGMFLVSSVSTGVALDQGASGQGSVPDFQQPHVTTILGQTNTPGQLKMSAQKNVPGSKKDQSPQYIPGEVLVKFKQGVDDSKKKNVHDKMGAEVLSEIRQIGVHKVKSKQGQSTEELIRQYKNDPDVLYAEPNLIYQIQATPNDPEFSTNMNLWGMHNIGQSIDPTGRTFKTTAPLTFTGVTDADIDAPEAWDLETGNANVIVAVIDTGVDYNHPDLAANMIQGYDFVNNDNDPMDDYGHGTHVAGTIAARGNNGTGVVGVSWQASIMPLKICDLNGACYLDAAVQAVLYAAEHGAKVANNSWGGFGKDAFSQALLDAINVANQSGMLFVAAAANANNNNDKTPVYPCNYTAPNVICVAATDQSDNRAGFSDYGVINVDLAAPGVDILSTVPSGTCAICSPSGYFFLDGTSMATPHVAGAAALAIARFGIGTLTTEQLKNLLIGSTDKIGSLNGLVATGGRLNVNNALRASAIVSVSPASIAAPAGQSMSSTITVKSLNNFSGTVTLNLASSGPNLTGSISPNTVTVDANGSATSTVTVYSTAGMAAGEHFLTVQATYINALGQSESPSISLSAIVQTDLAVTAVTGNSSSVQAGRWFAVTDTAQNQGPGQAQGFYVGYYLSTDNVITDADTRIGSRWVANLSPGATSIGNATDVWVPAGLAVGTYYLGAIVDDVHTVPDSNPLNNSMAASTIIIDSAGPPTSLAAMHNYNDGVGVRVATDAVGNSIVSVNFCKTRVLVGNVLVCTEIDTFTIKYSPEGTTLWTANYDSGAGDWAKDMKVDGSGNVYVTIQSCQTAGYCATYDTITIKYDTNGNMLWSTRYPHSVSAALGVDGTGNVYVTGGGCVDPYAESGCYLTTIKYDANGNKLWDSQEPTVTRFTGGRAITWDSAGNVYVAADYMDYGYTTIKYGPNGGAPLWRVSRPCCYARAIALDASGNVYVSGLSHNGSNLDIATVKYDNGGNQLWANDYDNGGDDTLGWWNAVMGQIAVDASGNVTVAGVSSNGLNNDYLTIKYDTNGNSLWTARFDGGRGMDDILMDLKMDGSGNVYVTGFKDAAWGGWNPGGFDYAAIKYGPDGHPLWFGSYDTDQIEFPYNSAIDHIGNIYLTGYGSSSGELTVKFILVPAPTVTTTAASSVTETCAILNGMINPNNKTSTAWFEWGATTAFGNLTTAQAVGGGTTDIPFSQQICGLLANTTYYFKALGQSSAGNGYGAYLTLKTPDLTAPTAPTNLVATVVSATQVNLSWTAATDNVGVLQYQIDLCLGSKCSDFVNVDIAYGTSYSFSWLTPGTTYKFRVWAVDAAWNYGAYSNIAKATTLADTVPPSTPTNLTATAVGVTQIDLTWNPSTDNTRVEYYKVERCTGSTCSNFVEIGITYESSYSDTSLTPGTDYRYQVRAMDAASLHSSYSNNATAKTWTDTEPPTAPADLAATYISRYEIGLGWAAATDNSGVVNYKVERCTGPDCTNFIEIAASTNIYAPTTHYDTGLAGATSYCYRVRAYDVTGNNGAYSNTTCVTTLEVTPPSTPTNLTATAVSNSQIDLTWTASTDNVGVVGYLVERCMGSTCTNFVQVGYPTDNSFADTGLTARKTYRYRVQAYDAANNISAYSNIASATTPR